MSVALDELDLLAARTFDGFVVRKDLVRTFSRQFPVPTYVVEFVLGRYCASTNDDEINEGLEIVEKQLSSRTVRAGEQELFKARAREKGTVKIIDLITARLDAKSDSYLVELPSLMLKDVRISPDLVQNHERMLTGGFYAEVEVGYDADHCPGKWGSPLWGGEPARDPDVPARLLGCAGCGSQQVHHGTVEGLPAAQHWSGTRSLVTTCPGCLPVAHGPLCGA